MSIDDDVVNSEVAALDTLLTQRWSCRGYLDDPVPHDVISRILDVARRTPSWCNTQPWHVHVTEGEGTERFRKTLSAHAARDPLGSPDLPFPGPYEGVHLERRRASGWQLYESMGIARGDRAASGEQMMKNFDLFGAPHVAIISTEASLGLYGAVDCGLFVDTFLLAAQAFGVASVPQAAIAAQAPVVREFFGLPANRLVLLGISFGYADPSHPANGYRTARQDLDEVVSWVRE